MLFAQSERKALSPEHHGTDCRAGNLPPDVRFHVGWRSAGFDGAGVPFEHRAPCRTSPYVRDLAKVWQKSRPCLPENRRVDNREFRV